MTADPDDVDVGLRSLKSTERFLGVSRSKLYELAHDGQLDFVKSGRKTLVTQVSIDRYVKNLPRLVPKQQRKRQAS
jgi:excisionase family DNA binding protein